MTAADDALLEAFEAGTVDPAAFRHRDHLSVAWRLMACERLDFAAAYARVRRGLQLICARAGAPERYRETQTLGWLALVHEAMQASGEPASEFQVFLDRHPDLLRPDALSRRYPRGALQTPAARSGLILPSLSP